LLTRALIVPTLFIVYAMYGWIPEGISWMSEVLVVQAAMPAGVFALVVVKNYGEDTETGLRSIMATMLVSLVSIPTWLWVGMKLLTSEQ
jgi:predicted permease